jgi:hypothetical protein
MAVASPIVFNQLCSNLEMEPFLGISFGEIREGDMRLRRSDPGYLIGKPLGGAWGTALANVVARTGRAVNFWLLGNFSIVGASHARSRQRASIAAPVRLELSVMGPVPSKKIRPGASPPGSGSGAGSGPKM